jgi:hypothetical protein
VTAIVPVNVGRIENTSWPRLIREAPTIFVHRQVGTLLN